MKWIIVCEIKIFTSYVYEEIPYICLASKSPIMRLISFLSLTTVLILTTFRPAVAQPDAGFTPEYGIVKKDCQPGYFANTDCSVHYLGGVLFEEDRIPICGIRKCNCGSENKPAECWLAMVVLDGFIYFMPEKNIVPEDPLGWAKFKSMDAEKARTFKVNTLAYFELQDKARRKLESNRKKREEDSLLRVKNSNLILLNWSYFRGENSPDSLSIRIMVYNPTPKIVKDITFLFKGYNAKGECIAEPGDPRSTLRYPGKCNIQPGQTFEIEFPAVFAVKTFKGIELKKIETKFDDGSDKTLAVF
jgi:hypothetical protein